MLTQDEKEMIYYSLSMRAAYIETGDPVLRAVDAKRMGKNNSIKALLIDQMKGLIMIEDLMARVLDDKL